MTTKIAKPLSKPSSTPPTSPPLSTSSPPPSAKKNSSCNAALDELVAAYATDERGIEVRAVAGGYKMYTKAQHHDVVRRFIKSLRPPLRLSMPALETLAVIAYKQPVTAPEISDIRGVNASGVISTLLDKKLITTAGRKEVMGRPILYKSSKEFLMRFGLSDLDELPSLKEFEALAREALGTDEGVAPASDESSSRLRSRRHPGKSSRSPTTEDAPIPNPVIPSTACAARACPLLFRESRSHECTSHVSATSEGMPSGQLDEDPQPALRPFHLRHQIIPPCSNESIEFSLLRHCPT